MPVRIDRVTGTRHWQVTNEEQVGARIGADPRPDVRLGEIDRLIRFLGVLLRAVEPGDFVALGFDLRLPVREMGRGFDGDVALNDQQDLF